MEWFRRRRDRVGNGERDAGLRHGGIERDLYVVIVPEPLFRMTPSRDAVNVPTTSGAPKEMPAMPR